MASMIFNRYISEGKRRIKKLGSFCQFETNGKEREAGSLASGRKGQRSKKPVASCNGS